jgi:hypothetical protein
MHRGLREQQIEPPYQLLFSFLILRVVERRRIATLMQAKTNADFFNLLNNGKTILTTITGDLDVEGAMFFESNEVVMDALLNCPVRLASVDNDAATIANRFGNRQPMN